MSEDKVYLLLGELKGTQDRILEILREHSQERRELRKEVDYIKRKINYAAGAYAMFVMIFTFCWNYFLPGGKS